MKDLKKILAVLLVLAMIAIGFMGCESTISDDGATSPSTTDAAENTDEGTNENTGEIYEWSLGTIYADPVSSTTYNAFGEWVDKFCTLVEEETDGQVIITPYYNSVLGSSTELYEQMRRNEIQMFIGQPMSTIDTRFGMWSVPGLFTDYDMVKELWGNEDAELFQLASEAVADNGGVLLSSNNSVFRGIYNNKHVIAGPSDMSDLKIRIYEDTICQMYWGGLCSANIIPYAEMFMSIQTGIVDGTEHTISTGVASLYEVCNYYSDINWQWTWGGAAIVNTEAYNALPSDLQALVSKAAWESADFYNELWGEYNIACESALEEVGISYYHVTEEDRAAWNEYARSLDAELRETVGADYWDRTMAVLDAYSN